MYETKTPDLLAKIPALAFEAASSAEFALKDETLNPEAKALLREAARAAEKIKRHIGENFAPDANGGLREVGM